MDCRRGRSDFGDSILGEWMSRYSDSFHTQFIMKRKNKSEFLSSFGGGYSTSLILIIKEGYG